MIPLRKSKLHFILYKQELVALLIFAFTLFIGLSLYSYSPNDPSFFYHCSNVNGISNQCGFMGSYTAAFLFFLFGTAAFLAIPLLLFLGYLLLCRRSWQEEWERVFFSILLVGVIASIFFLHNSTTPGFMYAGGLVGSNLGSTLINWFDQSGAYLFIYALLYICLIIICRFSFIHVIQYSGSLVAQLGAKWTQYHGTYYARACYGLLLAIFVRPFILFSKFSIKLLNGSLLEAMPDATTNNEPPSYQASNYSSEYNESFNTIQQPHYQEKQADDNASQRDINTEIPTENEGINTLNETSSAQKLSSEPKQYGLPNVDLFIGNKDQSEDAVYRKELEERAHILQEKLERFGVYGSVVSIKSGSVVTLFEYQPQIDTKISKILALEDDLALALQALSIRILAPIPGRSVVGFEVSNRNRKEVSFSHIAQSSEYEKSSQALPLILGEDTIGGHVTVDLATMPHLLVAGSTGSGKSVALNTMLISLLCKRTPDELKLILIDPKRLEFAPYADIAHLLFPIVTNPKKTGPILRWVVKQMEMRYEKMAEYGARNIRDYNMVAHNHNEDKFPFIVIVIDELSDLMMTVGREIEDLITRITQMARAAGIHMIIATQRPSVDVITGLIKVNFPSRISFRVTSKVDSRTILDCGGADKLLGRGDMLFLNSTASILQRVHGAFISDQEIERVVQHIHAERAVEYLDINQELENSNSDVSEEDQELYNTVVSFLSETDEVSISLLQRKFRIGYNRSARIIDILEMHGLIMPSDNGKTRRVIR